MIVLYTRPKLVRGEVRDIYESGEDEIAAAESDEDLSVHAEWFREGITSWAR